jgi:hypothetical protein
MFPAQYRAQIYHLTEQSFMWLTCWYSPLPSSSKLRHCLTPSSFHLHSGRNCIWIYSVSPSNTLTLISQYHSKRSNDGPRHTWPHPNGRIVYCLQEHSSVSENWGLLLRCLLQLVLMVAIYNADCRRTRMARERIGLETSWEVDSRTHGLF